MKKIKKSIKKTAKINNTTRHKIKKEINSAIKAAIETPNKTTESEIFWNNITKNKKRPTPEEVIAAIIEKLS